MRPIKFYNGVLYIFLQVHKFKCGFVYGMHSRNGLPEILFVANMLHWRLVHNQNLKVICLGINVNAIHIVHVLHYSLYYAVLACV